jgi:AAA family ATP:ADP antiporter
LGLGGIVGAFVGGEFTSFLVKKIGLPVHDLLLVSAGALALTGGLGWLIWRQQSRLTDSAADSGVDTESESTNIKGIGRSITRSRHLMLTVGIISLTVMTASFVDYQFKTVSWQAHQNSADLTVFLGQFYGRMSLVSFLIQLVLAPRLIRWVGVGNSLLVLPAALVGGAAGMILVPGLMAGMTLRGIDFSLKYSLDKTSRELLFLPIPLALKKRTKVFIDMFVDRWARGLAGGLLLLVTALFPSGLRAVSAMTLVLVFVWLALALKMRRAYVASFRSAVSRREIDLSALTIRIEDSDSLAVVTSSLKSSHEREVTYALGMLQDATGSSLAEAVRPLLSHGSPEVRRRAIDILAANREEVDVERVHFLLHDPDLDTRVAAVAYLCVDEDYTAFLQQLLEADGMSRNAAVAYVATRDPVEAHRLLITPKVIDEIEDCGDVEGCEGRRVLAGLPWLPHDNDEKLWHKLLHNEDAEVVSAAIVGVGSRGDLAWVPWLLEKLADSEHRVVVRNTLVVMANHHSSILADLESYLDDKNQAVRQRADVIRILAEVPLQASVEALIRRLTARRPNLRFEVLKSLGKLRSRFTNLAFDEAIISGEICEEAGRYIQTARMGMLLSAENESEKLLLKKITETQHIRLESVFRLLGLLYPAKDLLNAYYGVMSGRRVLRANAQEFLDTLLTGNHRQLVLALLDESSAHEAWHTTLVDLGGEFAEPIRNEKEALAFLANSSDPWLAACAVNAGATGVNPESVAYLSKDEDEMLSSLEKVLLLQHVEMFSTLPSDQLAALAEISREVSLLAGDTVYHVNDSPDGLYLVLEGSVHLSQGERMVSVAGPQVSFGAWALFDDEPRVVSAEVMEDTRLLRIGRSDFNDLLADDVRIAQGIIRTVAGKLRELVERAV